MTEPVLVEGFYPTFCKAKTTYFKQNKNTSLTNTRSNQAFPPSSSQHTTLEQVEED